MALLRPALVALVAALVLGAAAAAELQGTVVIPTGEGAPAASSVEVTLTDASGSSRVAHLRKGGAFSFLDVSDGEHVLEVAAPGLSYPTAVLTVETPRAAVFAAGAGAEAGGSPASELGAPIVQARTSTPSGSQAVAHPLILVPTARVTYFESKSAFDPVALIKTPYGMMGAFMLFAVFVLPRLKPEDEPAQGTGGAAADGRIDDAASAPPAQTLPAGGASPSSGGARRGGGARRR